jgi:hypothetical protein
MSSKIKKLKKEKKILEKQLINIYTNYHLVKKNNDKYIVNIDIVDWQNVHNY